MSEKGQSFEKVRKTGSKNKSGSASGQFGSKGTQPKAGSGLSAFKASQVTLECRVQKSLIMGGEFCSVQTCPSDPDMFSLRSIYKLVWLYV